MGRFTTRVLTAGIAIACLLLLAACEPSGTPVSEEPMLRIHDVSGLRIESLDDNLNELLSREDLPLSGKVELLDENRLAVNASRYLQDEIAQILDELREQAPADAVQRPFRVEYWFLRMAKTESSDDVPGYIADDLQPLLANYEGYSLSVEDYLESFHSGSSSIDHISSGMRTNIFFRKVGSTRDEVMLNAHASARSGELGRSNPGIIRYAINHTLEPGKPLVLGRAHTGGSAGETSYQVLVAFAEWSDATD